MPNTFLIFGLTGDLMKKKGIPALFSLWKHGLLSKDFRVIGLSRKVWSREKIAEHIRSAAGPEVPEAFVDVFSIFTGEGENADDVAKLKAEFNLEAEKLLTYLCVSPELYEQIIKSLAAANLFPNIEALLIEKPFGQDLASAQDLQKLLLHNMKEEQMYRIDHFLAKEAMQDLSAVKAEDITSIEVYLNEPFGVEKRGAMYDPVGAFRDVGQNHLLEAAAAVLGDRLLALKALHILSAEEIKTATKRGQYEGYQTIEGVAAGSQTETYFKVESWFEHHSERIPLLLEAGKLRPSRREVVLTFKSGEKKTIPFESGTNEYEILFKEAFAGDRHRFVSIEEVEALWKFTDPIEKEWQANTVPLLPYAPHTGASA